MVPSYKTRELKRYFGQHLTHWDFTLKKLNDDFFISINVYVYSFYVADQDTSRYSICSAQEKCVRLAEPYTTDS